MIKLVVTDVDGTIVGKDEVLHQEFIDYVKGLKQKGIGYTIATGRVDGLAKRYVQAMGIDLPYVACNGGTILKGDQVLVRKTIPLSALREVILTADRMGMSVMYSVDGIESAYRETDYVKEQQTLYDRYHNPAGFSEAEWNTLQPDKVIVMAAVRDGSIGAIEELCRRLPGDIGYKRYANKAIDILHAQATKEGGVKALADLLGIEMEEILFAGDDLNDIQSFRQAGIGVAVANAQPEAKAAADYIAAGECCRGVIEAVERFVIKGESL